MYANTHSVWVDENELSKTLCGKSRPGHFRGVCTVVAKLFNIIMPDSAVFGMKDFQQLAIIRQMTRDLNFPVEIIPAETVREPDGLALSSRNRYLTAAERSQAPVIRQALLHAANTAKAGAVSASVLRKSIVKQITRAPLATVDYIEIVDAETLQPVVRPGKNTLIAAAVFFGKTRLIDNILLQ